MKNMAIAAAAMPPATATMIFVFTIGFFPLAHTLKLSINPNAYTSRHKKITAGCNTTRQQILDARELRRPK
jgi:hypothetical protein